MYPATLQAKGFNISLAGHRRLLGNPYWTLLFLEDNPANHNGIFVETLYEINYLSLTTAKLSESSTAVQTCIHVS